MGQATNVDIEIGNGIFAQDGTNFDQRYNALAQKLYKSELQYLDFVGNEAKSVRAINSWVYNQTHGRIGDILSHISPETIMLIINTLYFRGYWEEPFLPVATRNRRFFPNGPDGPDAIDVPTMAKSGCMPYYLWQEENVRVLGVPYKQNVTMYIFLPINSTRAHVRALQEKISAQTINDIVTKMKMKSVSLLLPLMHVTNSFSLKSALQQLGLYALFDRNSANLYRLLNIQRVNGDDSEDILEALQDTKDNAIKLLLEENPECQVLEKQGVDRVTCLKDNCRAGDGFCVCCAETDDFRRRRRDTTMDFLDQMNSTVYVNEMLHKIDLVVNERGTEGGAATATLIDRISSQVNFIVNGPFLMIIREETTRLPLFYGAIYSPNTNVDIEIGNGIFTREGIYFDQRYSALAQKLYKSELQYLDFNGSESKPIRAINSWVKNHTHGRIDDIVSLISPETVLLIINTLYFRGYWEEPFLSLGTSNRRFFPNGPDGPGAIDVPTMVKTGCMPFYNWQEETYVSSVYRISRM
ncbi:serine protease inhibitor 28Dc-like [Anopheles albimanus]|uniref:serine protease inhibitor 28Dc-like n=1 Tax=Anopheles albimanus TaxID=7167 RepID=UPI00163E130A|nr:serine protease inhibitor 28Dc-like [Anopheles albimanus]